MVCCILYEDLQPLAISSESQARYSMYGDVINYSQLLPCERRLCLNRSGSFCQNVGFCLVGRVARHFKFELGLRSLESSSLSLQPQ
jgi:hypothetical protein